VNPGTLTVKLFFPFEVPTLAVGIANMPLPAGQTGGTWRATFSVNIQQPGVFNCLGTFENWSAGALIEFADKQTAIGINASGINSVDMSVQFSVANVGNILEVDGLTIEYLPSP
jgi:hypothetical protein